jgi:predicted secreted hydrolase
LGGLPLSDPHNKEVRLAIAALTAVSLFADYRVALPGHRFQFPRDHFDHPDYQTEWWYYTGNLRDAAGHRFGFELVFFRQGQHRGPSDNPSAWRMDDLYLAHLALTDIDGRRFRYHQRLNRAGPGIAGISENPGRIWNGNWQVQWDTATDVQTLSAVAEGIRLQLRLTPRKPVVIHGANGVSQTAEGAGRASYYTSFPLLEAQGSLNGAAVTGTAWMDHEWFTNLLAPAQQGWDWFSIQLQNNTELMLFQIRRADGTIDPHSSGTFIDAAGRATALQHGDFTLQPLDYWRSPKTGTRYPVKWRIAIPSLKLELDCAAAIPDQELVSDNAGPTYWEGAAVFTGSSPGVGYLEMTGYGLAMKM